MSSPQKVNQRLVSRRKAAMNLQAIEGNPLDAEQVAMFEMFEAEGWNHQRRIDFIKSRYVTNSSRRII